ncbi:MAG: glycosyltransferase family 2 protein [Actinomycetota bacterium]|nr:glycosyltransferase family 2 protein [Actinomycetota bacterium]
MITVTAIVLAYGDEPWLEVCVEALLASRGVTVDVVVVDNGCTSREAVEAVAHRPGVMLLRPGTNLGFAGGCNAGAAPARGQVLAFVNSDAVVEPDALARLAAVACRRGVGIASGNIRLADRPDRLNSAGNPISYVGLSWAGAFGDLADAHPEERDVAGASGAGFAIRRRLWEELGGFDSAYFAYHEDVELSWRCWRRGRRVVYVPDAVVIHHYDFARNPRKYELLERNRLLFVLTVFEARTLALIIPALLAVEAAMLAVSVEQGWWSAKIRGWGWILRHVHHVRQRRAQLRDERRVADRDLAWLLEGGFAPRNVDLSRPGVVFGRILAAYWELVRRLL